jgi:hypothetical protein
MSSPFTTIRSEGALLPPEVLTRIADADGDLGGLSPTDYHLGESERLGEAISRSWNRLVGVWASFGRSLDGFTANDPGTGATRERWLAPLFQELAFGRLQVAKAREIDGIDYPISHEWDQVPIHLVGAGVELERRTKGVAGAARMSPHALVQDYLNRTESLWGIVSNGRELRMLRDNVSLTRQAYLAFDLEAMFSGEVYADFALLWLLCHESRFEPQEDRVEGCWLERWTQAAQAQGTRALNTLREGVERAISTLGAGFVAHPANVALREALRSGELATTDYYRELLRLIYRLIFLFVAEDRRLLHPEGAPERARVRYQDFYSTTRLRKIAERLRGGPHPDLWRSLVFVCSKLASDDGCPELGLPFLGSSLFSPQACPHVDQAELANRDLLGAVRALAFTEQRQVLRPIDYRNIGSEELGSIYESLLELHPEVHHESGIFELATAAGNERKTTGSYYTPTSLISALLDTALDPVLDEAATKPDPEAAILGLRVLDPASGSGHFLVAAAHRIAKRLAAIRTDEPEPSPDAYRQALREVIGHCIFGIDVNPMATELCKVSLWMEAVEPGRPLSFLDHHIVCGNSLLGATPRLLAGGIPDEAFITLEGDDKEIVKSRKNRNRAERKGQATLFGEAAQLDLVAPIAKQVAELEATTDDSPESVHSKQQVWEALEASDEFAHAKLVADAWCVAFVMEKTNDAPVLTQGVLELLERNPSTGNDRLHEAIRRLASQYRFLHAHLAFPQVFRLNSESQETDNPAQGWSGGFDLVLGNPPWEQVEMKEREWFARARPDITAARTAALRKQMISSLRREDPGLHQRWIAASRQVEGERHLLGASGRYPLCGVGRINTYAVFSECMRSLTSTVGRTAAIVPSGIVTDDTTKKFFQEVVDSRTLVAVYDFANKGFFPDVASAQGIRFCLLTLAGAARPVDEAQFVFRAHAVPELNDDGRCFSLAPEDFVLLNPNTRTSPIFESRRDALLTKGIYRRVPVLLRKDESLDGDPWAISFKQGLFNMSTDSGLFRTQERMQSEGWTLDRNIFRRDDEEYLPLYEAKMIHQFNHRFGDYGSYVLKDDGTGVRALPNVSSEDLANPFYSTLPRYWAASAEVEKRLGNRWTRDWLLGWRGISSALDARTLISTVIPRSAVGNIFLILSDADPRHLAALIACLNSFVCDYVARQKLGGANFSFYVMEQLTLPSPQIFDRAAIWDESGPLLDWLLPRVLELCFTTWDLAGFGRDAGWTGPPFRWLPLRRRLIRAELDAACFLLYGLDREETSYVLDSFDIVQRNEEKEFGEYHSKRLILERYDAMRRAVEIGERYETPLDPPPADPRVSHDRDSKVP